jgi:hypothetical protein
MREAGHIWCRLACPPSVWSVRAQGWYRDPYGRHDHRWISDGRPTALVRDNGVESYDHSPRGGPILPATYWEPVASPLVPRQASAGWASARLQQYLPVLIIVAVVGQFVIWELLLHVVFWALTAS